MLSFTVQMSNRKETYLIFFLKKEKIMINNLKYLKCPCFSYLSCGLRGEKCGQQLTCQYTWMPASHFKVLGLKVKIEHPIPSLEHCGKQQMMTQVLGFLKWTLAINTAFWAPLSVLSPSS